MGDFIKGWPVYFTALLFFCVVANESMIKEKGKPCQVVT